MSNKELLKAAIEKHCVTYAPEGETFKLSAGGETTWYIVGRNLTFRGDAQELIAHCILEEIAGTPAANFDTVGGLELGAVPVGVAIAGVTKKNSFAVRKQPKDHGDTNSVLAGTINKGDKVLVVEDTVTTGTSLMKAVEAVLANGNEVVGAACLVDRADTLGKELAEKNIPFFAVLNATDFDQPLDKF
jgi:orotate phosphoribosyltransferase